MLTNKGQALIELIIGFTIISIILGSVTLLLISAREARERSANILTAETSSVLQAETLRSIREAGWDKLVNGIYHLEQLGSAWNLVGGSEVVGDFTRQVEIKDACRDGNGILIECPAGTVDPSTKKIIVRVSWSVFFGGSVDTEIYFSRYLNNTTWVQTTESEFGGGTTQGTRVTNSSGGEVQLSLGGCSGNWKNPAVCKIDNTPGQDGRDIVVQGDYAYMLSGGGSAFLIYDISDPENFQPVSSLNLGAVGHSLFVQGNYAYLSTSHNSRELRIFNITNKSSPAAVGNYNAPGTADGLGIFAVGNTAYLSRSSGSGDDFFTLDVTNPASPVLLDSIDLASNGNSVYVSGNYAYVSTSHDSRELTVINISNPTNISLAGFYNTPGTADGLSMFIVGSTAYLTTGNGGDELYLLDVSNLSSISLISSLDLGGDAYDVFVSGSLAFVGTSNSSREFQVIDISTTGNPTLYGFTNLNGPVVGIYIVEPYAYLATQDNLAEFQTIKGGPGSGSTFSGTFESGTFDAGTNVGFNYLTWNAQEPPGTDIKFQIATNNDGATWNFVGPDATSSTFFENPGAIPLTLVNARYIRYKVTLVGTATSTPILESVTINYSP